MMAQQREWEPADQGVAGEFANADSEWVLEGRGVKLEQRDDLEVSPGDWRRWRYEDGRPLGN